MKYNQNNYPYQSLGQFWAVEYKLVTDVLYRLKTFDTAGMDVDLIRQHIPPVLFYRSRKWSLKYVSHNNDNLSIYYVDIFKEKLLRISNHWSYISFDKNNTTKMWIRGCWWELHGKRAMKPYHLPLFKGFYGGQIEFSKLQPVHK